MPNASVFSRTKLSFARLSLTSAAPSQLTLEPCDGKNMFEHDHEMESLVAATRLELGSRCLEIGDYEAGLVAFTAVLQHAPLGTHAVEAQRGLVQCEKGLKLESLDALRRDSDANVEEKLQQLGVPRPSTPPQASRTTRLVDSCTKPARNYGVATETPLEPEPELELHDLQGRTPQSEPESEQTESDEVLITRSALLSQVEKLQGIVQNLQVELAKKSSELDAMRQTTTAANAAEQARRELERSRGEAMRQEIKGAMKAEKQRRYER